MFTGDLGAVLTIHRNAQLSIRGAAEELFLTQVYQVQVAHWDRSEINFYFKWVFGTGLYVHLFEVIDADLQGK